MKEKQPALIGKVPEMAERIIPPWEKEMIRNSLDFKERRLENGK